MENWEDGLVISSSAIAGDGGVWTADGEKKRRKEGGGERR